MKDGIIFVAGIYGVGKSTLCERLSLSIGIPCYSAGDLISALNGETYGRNKTVVNKAMLSVINRISERGAQLLSTEDFLVIDALYHERPLNEKMQSRLNRLIEMGIVEHIGRKKYILARSLYAATGKTGVHTRRVGLDRDTNKELLLKHIRQNNEVGTPFKELQQVLPGLDRNQIRILMRELRESGKVFCEGTTSAARWLSPNNPKY